MSICAAPMVDMICSLSSNFKTLPIRWHIIADSSLWGGTAALWQRARTFKGPHAPKGAHAPADDWHKKCNDVLYTNSTIFLHI